MHSSVHCRQIGHKRHIGRIQQIHLRLVVEESGHSVDQCLPQKCSLGTVAVRWEQSHDAASLDEDVQHGTDFLQNGLSAHLHTD